MEELIPNSQTEEQELLKSQELATEATEEKTVVTEEPSVKQEAESAPTEDVEPTIPQATGESEEEDSDVENMELPEEEKEIEVPDTNEGIVERLATLAENPEQSEKAELDLLKQMFYRRLKDERSKQLAEYLAAGGVEEEYQPASNPLEEEFKKSMAIIREQRAKLAQAVEHQKEINLEKKKIIIERLKELASTPEDANKAYEEVRTLQQQWKETNPVPATAANEIWKNYQVVVEQYYDMLKTNNALRDYDYKKNLEAKTKLCEQAEELMQDEDIIRAARTLQQLHQEYREIGPVAKELREELWLRFKTASAAVNKRHAQYFDQIKEQEEENLAKKTTLCEKIEAIATDSLQNFSSWENITKQVLDIQTEWREIGHATKKMNNKIYERFRSACDEFFTKKADFFRNQRKLFAENMAKKTSLCEKAEELKTSTEWQKTTDALVELQKAWKEIGPTAYKSSAALWERFNGACNEFFDNKKKVLGGQRKEESENLNKKKAIIKELKELAEEAVEGAVERVKALQEEWKQVGHVPFKEKDKLYTAYREAMDALYEKLPMRQRKDNNHANRSNNNPSAKVDANSLFHIYEAKKAELTTYETNFSFLSAHSKSGNALVDSMQKKIIELKKEVEEVYARLKAEQKQAQTDSTETLEE